MRWRWLATAAAGVAGLALLIGGTMILGEGDPETTPSAGMTLFRVERSGFTRTAAAEGYLHAVQATPITVPVKVEGMQRIAWMAPDGAEVKEEEEMILFDSGDLELELADGEADLEIALLRIGKSTVEAEASRGNLSADLALAEREAELVERFASRDPQIFSRHEIIDSEIDQERAQDRSHNTRSRGEAVERQSRSEMDLLRIEKSRAELEIRQAAQGLAALVVKAPHAGMLVLDRQWNGEVPRVGDEVWPGQRLAEIADPRRMMARAYVLEADASGLRAGCRAELVVEAHPEKTYPARVDRVDALAKRRHWEVPVQYFEVVLIPEETDPVTMKPGQRIRADIVLEEIPDALTVPPQALFDKEGRLVVYREEEGRLAPLEVSVGPRSLSRVQVLEGLREGDRVALRDPRRSPEATLEGRPARGAAPSPGSLP